MSDWNTTDMLVLLLVLLAFAVGSTDWTLLELPDPPFTVDNR